ncbi:hypothetical protein QBC38DRAFT_369521 [Podospora fimiseda]|uniref:Sulphur transport domain-containing protein n=1 Tax=Podospora fimiseda TaxID=252190 RepID=A0AAN7BKU8_9PEZI|nr:hypothetical protein QBC38DRAFT_369521 [Podospora fimiseda]
MNTLISGAIFGGALTASGVYQPSVIVSQLSFTNFHMIQVFLTAAAGSAAVVSLAPTSLSPRPASPINLFSIYDGNILGGLLLGTGMMLSGACPGTVLAQLGVGVKSGFYAFAGAAAAGVVWSAGLGQYLKSREKKAKEIQIQQDKKELVTVQELLGVSKPVVLLGLESMFLGIVYLAAKYTVPGPEAKIPPPVGGLLIAASQLFSLVLRKSLLGTSTSYEEVGGWVLGGKLMPEKYKTMLFSAGMIGGAAILSRLVPAFGEVTEVAVSPVSAALGGFLMILGSRMAGGCTSGHGISGISLLSVSSFFTVAACFFAGGVTGLLLS